MNRPDLFTTTQPQLRRAAHSLSSSLRERRSAASLHPARRQIVLVVLLALLLLFVWLAPPHHAFEGVARYASLHLCLEVASIMVAGLVFGVAWNSYSSERPGNIIILALGLLATGLVDFVHALSFLGMPDLVTPSDPEKAINFWLAARLLQALVLTAVALRSWEPLRRPALRHVWLFCALLLAALVIWIGLFHQHELPRTFIAGQGLTPLKIGAEYVIVALLVVPAVLFFKRAREPQVYDVASLFAAAAISMLSELSFTLYADVTDIFNLLGHVYKVIAFGMIYRAVFIGSVREPFERVVQAEAELRQQHALLSNITETSPIGITVWNLDGHIAFANMQAERVLERSKTELSSLAYGAPEWRITDFSGRPIDDSELPFRKVAESGMPVYEVEMAVEGRDGKRILLSVNASPLRNGGVLEGVVATLDDVTQRKAAEEMLQTSEARLKLAMSAARMGAWSWDIVHDKVDYSQEAKALFGLDGGRSHANRDEFLASVHPADRDRVAGELREALMMDRAYWVDFRVMLPDTGIRWLSAHGAVARDAGGTATKMAGVLLDITGKKQSELALQHAVRALRSLSAANERLIHAQHESELLNDVCRVIVEVGGYSLAWVGKALDDEQKTVQPVAQFGDDSNFLGATTVLWSDSKLGHGPTGTAIRTRTTQVNQSFRTNPYMAPWQDEASKRGYQSSIAFPLADAAGVHASLTIYSAEADAFDADEVKLLQELADDLAFGIVTLRMSAERDRMAEEQLHYEVRLRDSLVESIQALSAALELRDPYTAGHQRRVAALAAAIAYELGLPEQKVQGLRLAASIHDVGKIYIPSEILNRPGKLGPLELELIKTHAGAGYDILKDIRFPWPIARIVHEHHEHLDGSGYPNRLKGEQILIESRIVTVADVVEAMTSHRPYRAGLGLEVALAHIEEKCGDWYDPAVVAACNRLFREARYSFEQKAG